MDHNCRNKVYRRGTVMRCNRISETPICEHCNKAILEKKQKLNDRLITEAMIGPTKISSGSSRCVSCHKPISPERIAQIKKTGSHYTCAKCHSGHEWQSKEL